ncbi:MAG: cation diffusion facilitator family transporter [Acidiferrobacterales bacterium]|nr:cation diffusion facilitator family transporter [Acidiferrobacterales bacterium]
MHDHPHSHTSGHMPAQQSVLVWALLITLGFAAVEALAGWWSGSLALLGDAGHMVSDAFALGFASLAAWVARKPPTPTHTYGLGRADVIAAMINGLFMLVVVAGIAIEAIDRFRSPQPVLGGAVISVALLGLVINAIVAALLHRGEQTLNVRGAMLHVIGDLLGSVAALIAGLVVYSTGWTPIDPILSLFICALILFSSVRLLREAVHIVMEGVPPHIDLRQVGETMLAGSERVRSVHDLHIWNLSSGTIALSAHVLVDSLDNWDELLEQQRQLLHDRFGIEHVTLQPETGTHVLRPMSRVQ